MDNAKLFEPSNACSGCGSFLGLKFLLELSDKNTIIVTAPGEVALHTGIRANIVNSLSPAATARGLAVARPESKVIAYVNDVFTEKSMPSLLDANENLLYVCYNDNAKLKFMNFSKSLYHRAAYSATANVAYPDDFSAKLKKAIDLQGFRFIDLLTPCPVLWKFDPSNMMEIGRMATETSVWPLFEFFENSLKITKTPPQAEPVQRYVELLKMSIQPEELQRMQSKVSRAWRSLNEGRLI